MTKGVVGAVLTLIWGAVSAVHAQTPADSTSAPPAISAALSFTGEVVSNVSGGASTGTVFVGVTGVEFNALFERLVGWPGARLYVTVIDTHGGAPSNLVGDVQGVSELEAPGRLWLEEAWLQQNLYGNRLSLLIGRYDLNSEFYFLTSTQLFLNSSFGIGPEFALSGVGGPSIFPNTAVGGRVALKPSPNTVWRTAILDGVPANRPDGGIHPFAPGDGLLLVSELALASRSDTLGKQGNRRFQIGRGNSLAYKAKLAVGGWYYTATFPDLYDTLSTGAPVMHRGSWGAYLIGEKTLWSAEGGGPQGLSAFAQLGLGDSRVDQIGSYAGTGLMRTAPFAGRAGDEVGLAVAVAFNGSQYKRAHVSPAAAAAEITPELTYLAQVYPWLSLQPNVQYVINPGRVPATPNAVVLGLRIAASY